MQSNIVHPVPVKSASESSARVLMIEPDARRAVVLQNVLRPRLEAELVIVKGIQEALPAIARQIPDLVLTSTFLAPADEATLTEHLKKIPDAAHVQVVNAPYFLDLNGESPDDPPPSRVMKFLGRRAATIRPRCDVETFQKQIEEYLERAVSIRSERNLLHNTALLVPTRTMSGSWLVPAPQSGATGLVIDASDVPLVESGHERRRARRLNGNEMPSMWSVRLPWGEARRIVNISTSGVLLESTSKTDPGTTMDLKLVGNGTDLIVPARTIRADVAHVDGLGVKYHLAIAFSQEVILPELHAPHYVEAGPSPRDLADLMTGVLGDVEHASRAPQMRERFESDLRRLLRLRDVQIRETPQIPDDPSQSICFTIPQSSGRPRILQVTFESGRAPSAMDLRLLKSAACAAALVLEFAPLADAPPEWPHRPKAALPALRR